jgi:hypothetical protein
MDKKIARIDLEKIGANLIEVRQWYAGWRDDGSTPADIDEVVEGQTIPGLLAGYEKQGYTCEMCDKAHGRALRGAITRVDIVRLPDGWHYRKFPFGWSAKTRPLSDEIKTEAEIHEILEWCELKRWTVRRWPDGARAFRGEPKPVRDRAAILSMRRRASQELYLQHQTGTNKVFYDFAFDF